ncbi:MAG: 2-iminobutanoate/2-iminopropanoate deaminase [Acidimicrobiaceae bacterium]
MSHVNDNSVFRLPTTSHAVVHAGLAYVSGVVASSGDSFELIGTGIAAETAQAIINVETILRACGSSLEDLVKVTVFLDDVSSFLDMEHAYGLLITSRPARTTVYVSQLPLGAAIEIDAIGAISSASGVQRDTRASS